jgi:hypothetical protein
MRPFVGLKINFMNAQTGPQGHVQPVRGDEEKRLLNGDSSFNCFKEKSKVIVNLTPQLQDPGGVINLEPGMPENQAVKVDWYELILDGKRYRGDAIGETDIEVNNQEANFGLTPRLVFGPGLSGDHTIQFAASVNGHVVESKETLKLNG